MSSKMFQRLPKSSLSKQISRLNIIAGKPNTAFKFGSDVKKIELVLLEKNVMGPAIGLKKFWRVHLPTLKFHNDDVEFFCTRVLANSKEEIRKVPAKVIIHDSSNNTSEFDCASLDKDRILKKLVRITGATPIPQSEIPHIQHPNVA